MAILCGRRSALERTSFGNVSSPASIVVIARRRASTRTRCLAAASRNSLTLGGERVAGGVPPGSRPVKGKNPHDRDLLPSALAQRRAGGGGQAPGSPRQNKGGGRRPPTGGP